MGLEEGDWNSDVAALFARKWVEGLAVLPVAPRPQKCIADGGQPKTDHSGGVQEPLIAPGHGR
eukprot:4697738-Pyramimonas_sp.AAC.1